MELQHAEIRSWDCLQYCQTQENCLSACGIEPPHAVRIPAIPTNGHKFFHRFILRPQKSSTRFAISK